LGTKLIEGCLLALFDVPIETEHASTTGAHSLLILTNWMSPGHSLTELLPLVRDLDCPYISSKLLKVKVKVKVWTLAIALLT